MKILKIVVIIVVVLIAIPLILGLFAKKDYTVSREVVINKPTAEVFEYVKYLKNQDYYNKWTMADPNMKKDFTGLDGTIGFIYAWESEDNNVGKGEMEIKGITANERIDTETRFEEPFEGTAQINMTTESISEDQTKVKWTFDSEMGYPMNAMLIFMDMDDVLGPDLETSLNTLKNILENK